MKKYLIILLPLILTSCSYIVCKHIGSIDFINTSQRGIYVKSVDGENMFAPVGYLIPNATKGMMQFCGKNDIPQKVYIKWVYLDKIVRKKNSMFMNIPEKHINHSTVDLSKINQFRLRKDIVFTFDENSKWSVSLSE